MSKYDETLALDIHHQLNCTGVTENAILPEEKKKEKYRPRTLVDHTLELIDPTPNVHTLFVQFNARFFWNILLPVQVKWSARMTSCAGICYFNPKSRECVISLSTPLLKLRPRKDLVETLLHEMIHAYLFLKNDNRDRDGHGPIFCSHMKRINKEAGTNITVYHTFHDEVELYKTHWWRCNGQCQFKPPYFGTIRRATNRAPGPNDFWFAEHQRTCGGQFIKVKEPEKQKSQGKSNANAKKPVPGVSLESKSIIGWLNKSATQQTDNKTDSKPNNVRSKSTKTQSGGSYTPVTTARKTNGITNSPAGLVKLGNTTNNVHGWGTGGPGSSSGTGKTSGSNSITPSVSKGNPKLNFSGTLGGSATGRSNLLDIFSSGSKRPATSTSQVSKFKRPSTSSTEIPKQKRPSTSSTEIPKLKEHSSDDCSNLLDNAKNVECPVCNTSFPEFKMNEHLDLCLSGFTDSNEKSEEPWPKRKKEDKDILKTEKKNTCDQSTCPVCNERFKIIDLNDHLDICLGLSEQNSVNPIVIIESPLKNNLTKNGIPTGNGIPTIDLSHSSSTEDSDDTDIDSSHISLNSSNTSLVKFSDSPMKCLICNQPLSPEMSLNEHLEECIGKVFNDESFVEDEESKVENEEHKKYPCPICMQLILEIEMDQHVDKCLAKCDS